MNPAVSVVLPVHNRADVLPRAISSVIEQSLENWELIVVDDCSTDRSAEIALSFHDERIRLVGLSVNRGGNAARNAGIREAGTPLIAFLDSDDAYLPQKLERIVAHFDNRRDLDLLVDSFIKIQQDTFIPANIELIRRHPEYLDQAEYRPGLGYALRLSLWRKLKKGDPAGLLKDIGDLKRAFGSRKTLSLLSAALRPRPRLG